MSYKKIYAIVFLSLLVSGNMFADTAKRFKASLKDATVFFKGAELNHTISAPLTTGVNQIEISELSPDVDINSLRIKTTKGVIVASFEFSKDFLNKKALSTSEKTLKDSIKLYSKKIETCDIAIKTNDDLLELLKANKAIGGTQNGVSVAELMKMMEYYSTKSNELNKLQSSLREQKDEAQKVLDRLQTQLQIESTKNSKSMGVLKLNLSSPLATTSDISITYFTPSAGWTPYYDINVPGEGQAIQIMSKAKVGQITGLDWNKVKLTLSTATPTGNKVAPIFNAWFLDFGYDARQSFDSKVAYGTGSVAQNSMMPEQLRGRSEGLKIRGNSAPIAHQPLYIINGQSASPDEYNSLSPDMIAEVKVWKGAEASAMYGSRSSAGVIQITTKSMDNFVNTDDTDLAIVYNVDLPYTITGNGKVQNIDLKKYTVEAEFKHYATPKLDPDVFIIAEIKDWQKLNLLSGKANITFDGTYVGETQIDATSTLKNLTLTLGADKRVSMKREKLQDFSSKKFLGKDIKQEFTYKITIKNNQNKDVSVILKDQYPLSNQKEITVELSKETTPVDYTNEEVGVLYWIFDLKAGEQKEFKLSYSVKYPKDKPINL